MTGRRVAIFTETFLPRVDGVVNTLRWSLEGLLGAGWQPLVVAPQGNTQAFAGVPIVGAPAVQFPLYSDVRLAYPTPDVCRQIDQFAPDIVHLAGPVTNGLGGLRYARSRQLPTVSTYHTALPEYARLYGLNFLVDPAWRALRAIHNGTSATLCPSRVTIETLRAHGFERLRLWSRGVDAHLFTPDRRSAAWRTRLGAGPGDVLVLSVGRLAREKKLHRLAAAVRHVPGVRVALVGSGPDQARVEHDFEGLPAVFTGPLYGTDLAAAYAAADIFAFPSDTETFGNVVLEAMACGLPVIGTTVGGQVDLISHEVTGLLFAPDDTTRFAEHLSRYRDHPLLRSRHGAAGLAVARARTWSRQVNLLTEHYATALHAQSPVRQTAAVPAGDASARAR